MSATDQELRSLHPTRGATISKIVGETNRSLNRRRCVWAGTPGSIPGDTHWADREYRMRWIVADNFDDGVSTATCHLDPGLSSLDVVWEVAGIYEDSGHPVATREGTPWADSGLVLGGLTIRAVAKQYEDEASPNVVGQSVANTRPLTYHRADQAGGSGFGCFASHLLAYDFSPQSFVYREGMTDPLLDAAVPEKKVLSLALGDYDPRRPVVVDTTIRTYVSTDSGLEGRPRFVDEVDPDVPTASGNGDEDEGAPLDDYLWVFGLGLSIWGRQ